MRFRRLIIILVALIGLGAEESTAQSNLFRDARVHIWLGVGQFGYHGPLDLLRRETTANFTREYDPAIVGMVSFPVGNTGRIYFRMMVGTSNLNKKVDEEGFDPFPATAQNEFLTRPLLFFEPQLIYNPFSNRRSRLLPYIYTGFGALTANPFGRGNQQDSPGTGIPGPERTVFALPIGIGVDYAISRVFSFFIDASYRFNLNYVGRNEIQGINPHDTSLLIAGFRLGFRQRRVTISQNLPEPDIPPPMEIPPYQPPLFRDPVTLVEGCGLTELNAVFFPFNSTAISPDQRSRLDENVQALRLNPQCCFDVQGFTDVDTGDPALNARIALERAQVVYGYYVSSGVDSDQLTMTPGGIAPTPCSKTDDDGGCFINRRVESEVGVCRAIPGLSF